MIDTTQLRCNIVRLALSGKLTCQNTNEDARDLLSKINSKRDIEQVIDVPYLLPSNWAWAKLEDVFDINPKVESKSDANAAFVPMERISAGFCREFSFEEQVWEVASKNHTKFKDGDVAFAKISPCFENRKSFIAEGLPNGIGGGTTELVVLRQPLLFEKYTYLLITDQRFIRAGSDSYKGIVGQQRIKADAYKNYLVPVAPLEEQHRIVEKVNEIFGVIDSLDFLQDKYFHDAGLLKNKLINASIQGKLTEQLLEDDIAERLYSDIQGEKDKLIKEKKIKKEKALIEISEEEIPFDIPDNWKWVRLGDICSKISSGNTPAGGSKGGAYVTEGFCFFREQNIYNDGIHNEGMVYITEELLSTRPNSTVLPGDILLNITGGSIGRCALIPDDFSKGSINQHILIIRVIDPRIRFYVHKCLCSPYYQKLITGNVVGDKDGFSAGRCKNTLIPLPPLAEQERIVDKIEGLLSLI